MADDILSPLFADANNKTRQRGDPCYAHCAQCGTQFVTKPYKISNSKPYKNNFCSVACKNVSQKNERIEKCEYCGNDVVRRKSSFYRSGNKHIFCNKACSAHWRSRNSSRLRFGYSIQPHQRKIYGCACIICGFDRLVEYCHVIPARAGGTIHPDNILVLCANHHNLFDANILTPDEYAVIAGKIEIAKASPKSRRKTLGPLIGRKIGKANRKRAKRNALLKIRVAGQQALPLE